MPDLSPNTLSTFPVQYPRWMVATGTPPETTKASPRDPSRMCSTLIRFGDDAAGARGSDRHGAIDIFGAFQLEIVAAREGTVVKRWISNSRDSMTGGRVRAEVSGVGTGGTDGGNYVMIRDDAGFYHYYAHMGAAPLVRPGERVRSGHLLGYLGDTGKARTTCQHLHYQVTIREGAFQCVNPYRELWRVAQLLGAGRNPGRWVVIPIR